MAKKKAKPEAEAGEMFRLAKRPGTVEEMRTAQMDLLTWVLASSLAARFMGQDARDLLLADREYMAQAPADVLQKLLDAMPKRP